MKSSYDQADQFPKEQVRASIQAGIAQAEEQMKSKLNHTKISNNRKRKILYAISSVAAAFVILMGSSYYSPALAASLSQIPFIGSVFGDSDLIGLQQAQKNGLTIEIGETQTINGISVTLDEILYDQNNISIGLIIEAEQELEKGYFGSAMDLTINGKRPSSSAGAYWEDVRSATTRTIIQKIHVTEDMPSAFDIGLILHGEKGEKWYFTAPIQKITDIMKVPVHHEQNVDGIHLTVTELSISKTGVSISYVSSEEGTNFEQDRGHYIEFLVEDQAGNEIMSHSGGVTGESTDNRQVFKSNKQFDPIDSTVTELTITPYVVIPSSGGGVAMDGNGELRKWEFQEDSIQPVNFESFTVKVPQ